jgi:acetyl-CoA C-acetyltransferase
MTDVVIVEAVRSAVGTRQGRPANCLAPDLFGDVLAAATIHSRCGSSQQAFTPAYGLVAGGVIEVAVAGGVESMDQVPMGTSARPEFGPSRTPRYAQHCELIERI